MKAAWDPPVEDLEPAKAADVCPRCRRGDQREHLMQTNGVAFYRCAACGHLFIVRTSQTSIEP